MSKLSQPLSNSFKFMKLSVVESDFRCSQSGSKAHAFTLHTTPRSAFPMDRGSWLHGRTSPHILLQRLKPCQKMRSTCWNASLANSKVYDKCQCCPFLSSSTCLVLVIWPIKKWIDMNWVRALKEWKTVFCRWITNIYLVPTVCWFHTEWRLRFSEWFRECWHSRYQGLQDI